MLLDIDYKGYKFVGGMYVTFGSYKIYMKPVTCDSALFAEGLIAARNNPDYSGFIEYADSDYTMARYRLDGTNDLKIATTVGNKLFASSVLVAISAASTLCNRAKAHDAMSGYSEEWHESVAEHDIQASLTFRSGLLASGTIKTAEMTINVYDDSVDPSTLSNQHCIIAREIAERPCFTALNKDAKRLFSIGSAYLGKVNKTADELGWTNFSDYSSNERLGYYSISFKSTTAAAGIPGASFLKSHVVKDTVNLGIYQTIEEVRDAHPDKNTMWIEECRYKIVSDEMLPAVMEELRKAPILSFDTETTGLNINFMSREGLADELVGVCISGTPGTGYYFPVQHKLFSNLCDGDHRYFMHTYMKDLLENKPIICHNLSYDWKVAYIYDINVNCVFDTMIAFGVTMRYERLDCPLGLKAICSYLFKIDMFEIEDFIIGTWKGSGITFADLPYDLVEHYGPADADITLRVYNWCLETGLLAKYNAERVFQLEVNFSKVVAYSEFWGYHIDVAQLPALEKEIQEGMEKEQGELFKIAHKEFNPNSSVQLSKIIYQELYPELAKEGQKPTTSKEILNELDKMQDSEGNPLYPFVHHLLEYRRYETTFKNFLKKKDQYVSPAGFVFAGVQQLGTNTGRVSIKDPNYQSYNDVVKKRVTGRPGYYIYDCDFAQIEYRVLASMAQQDALIKAFDDPDLDYHTHQAARMFSIPYAAVSKKLRQQSKGINFGLPYGMGDESLGKRVFGKRCPENTAKAADLRKRFFAGQEKIQDFFTRVRAQGVKNGYTETWLGRRRYYHKEVFSESAIRRQAGNHVIQGCLSGDVRIQTKEYGIVRLSTVVGQYLHIWDGKLWTKGVVTASGLKQECIVHFTNGQTIHCSPNHKFAVVSHRGNTRFVDCQDLQGVTSCGRTRAYRVAISSGYEKSDHQYTSESYYDMTVDAHNATYKHLDDIGSSFGIGVVLGRLASDGHLCYDEVKQQYYITQCVAEHEFDILPELQSYMGKLNAVLHENSLRTDRNEKLTYVTAYGRTLACEVSDLDIRHHIHDNIFADTELLRGFLRGMFDGDGGVSGQCIILTQGVQDDFDTLCRDIQKAMLFFGIRLRYRYYVNDRYALQVTKADIPQFLDIIGFMNADKQAKAAKIKASFDQHTFGKCLVVDYVEYTDDLIEMYDVCNTERGYYVADGIVTHNSAADIWKLAVTRFFNRIVKEGLLGKVLFNCFVHDELMGEVSVDLDPYEFIKMWREEYEVNIDRFCRLYAGFGWGNSWYEAKKADYPPQFIDTLVAKAGVDKSWDGDYKKLISNTKKDLYNFETWRVKDWYENAAEGTLLAPHIGGYLYDKVSDWWEDVCKVDPDADNYVLKKNDSGKPVATLDQVFKWFCQHEGMEFKPGWILPPDAAPASQGTTDAPAVDDEVDDETVRLEKEHRDMIVKTVYSLGQFLDVTYNVLYLRYDLPSMQVAANVLVKNYARNDTNGDIKLVLMTYSKDGVASAYPQPYSFAFKDFNVIQETVRMAISRG